MYYVNQKLYPNLIYPTLTGMPELTCPTSTVSQAGCGVCSASMVVTNLTGEDFSLADAIELSMAVGANHSPGTDMGLYAPYVAERFDLDLVVTTDAEEVRALLMAGYMGIANVGGDRPEDGWVGLFSHGGHFVAVVGIDADGENVVVLDPSQVPGKYSEEGRAGKVVENGYVLHVALDTLMEDCVSRATANYPEGSEFRRWLEFANCEDAGNRIYLFGLR
jgi:hypothetical protein